MESIIIISTGANWMYFQSHRCAGKGLIMVYVDQTNPTIAAVRCPVCNKRIMDIEKGTKGNILVKCPKCKNVSRIAVAFRLNRHNWCYPIAG